jgi:hypothetical protein
MITKITYYEVGDAYDAEGRGPFRVIATFSTESIADQYAAGKGNYGNDAKVREVTAFVCDSFEDVEEHNERVKLNNALGKLNKEEIDLLRKHFDQDVK